MKINWLALWSAFHNFLICLGAIALVAFFGNAARTPAFCVFSAGWLALILGVLYTIEIGRSVCFPRRASVPAKAAPLIIPHPAPPLPDTDRGIEWDVEDALIDLGYKRSAIRHALEAARGQGAPADYESLFREANRELAGSRILRHA